MSGNAGDDGRVRPTGLTVEGRERPQNVPPAARPRFGWRVADPDWGSEQAAYRVRVARTRQALADDQPLWDSGRVESASTTDVAYGGPPLAADARYYWTVTVWNDDGDSASAEPATFGTAPSGTWPGEWVGHQPDPGDSNGYRSEWRPADGDATEWVGVDLGEREAVEAVELHPAEPFDGPTTPDGRTVSANDTEEGYFDATAAQGPVAFGFPERYRVEVAPDPDFADATVVADRTDADQPTPRRSTVTVDAGAEGRYVRVVATDLDTYPAGDDRLREEQRAWSVFALAGLAVRDEAGTDLAEGCEVVASSSRESATWGRSHLTNGTYESAMASASPQLRTEFTLDGEVESARVHVSGLGYGDLYVNGERAGDEVLDPGWTDYDERVLYETRDVSDLLADGENALGLWLGRGWFSKPARQWTAFGSPRAKLHLTVEYADGTTREVTTGGDWRVRQSPIVENDIYDGETYDARREQPGWAEPGFDDADWADATVVEGPPGDLFPQQTDPIRAVETIEPASIRDHEDGYVVDFGQNCTGWVELDVTGAEAGDEVTIRHAEALASHGDLLTVDLRTADATDTYVARGDGAETYAPHFTYHGFRYAQVEGYPGDLSAEDVRARVVHTDFDSRGTFACSNEDLNRVQHNSRWGLRSNAHSVPTDCPQRDERQGFTGDGHLAAGALLYNFDAGRFHEKFLRDHADAQSPHGYLPATMPNGGTPAMTDVTWTYSWLHLPWQVYCHDGTERPLRDHYEGLCRYVDFWDGVAEDDLLPDAYSVFGDWVALEHTDGSRGGPTDLFTNAYYYRTLDVMADVADALDCAADAARFSDRAAAVRAAFNDRYFDAGAGHYRPLTQAANAVPLALGLAPEGRAEDVAAALAEKVREEDDGGLRTGFLGTPALLAALTDHGYADLAYEVASREEYPGWVYQVRQGATTVWERWNTDEMVDSGMNSRNHSPFALVSEWFFEALAGVRLTEDLPQDRRVEVAPSPVDDLDWAEGRVETPHGDVTSRWEDDGDGLALSVEVPWNLTAAVRVPDAANGTVRLGDEVVWDGEALADPPRAVQDVAVEGDDVVVVLASGEHDLRID